MSEPCASCGCFFGHHLYTCSTLTRGHPDGSPKAIKEFRGEYRWLSNFYPAVVLFEGETYPSTEHAYQAAKTLLPEVRREIQKGTASEAKRMGTQLTLRPDWEQIRLGVMEGLLRQKFAPGTPLRALLDATKGMEIIEGNWWHDRKWGQCFCPLHKGEGQNDLGKMLMGIRDC